MDSSSSGDDEAVSQEPTVASILGIRGPLRFRNHGSTQKAHVVLRQIDLSEEPGDERGDSNMVYFSLFAQKRIEVKPGKEILLAVASPDGKFIDSPVIFAGSIVGGNLSDTSQAPLKPVVDVVSSKPTGYTMPPRMRKAWPSQGGVGLTGSGSPSHPPLKSTSYNSVGVQCQAPTVSLAVETDPNPVKTFTSFAVQAAEPPKVTKPQVIQTEVSVRSYQDGVAQTVSDALPPSPTPVATISQPLIDQPEETAAELEHERSLSPMELDSPPSSPTLTPVVEPSKPTTPSDLRAKSLSYSPRTFSPPRLSIVTSSTSQTLVAPEEARISPMHLSPDDGDAPGLAITPEAIEFHRAYTPPVDRSNLQLPPSKAPSPPQRPPLGSPIIPAADHPAPASVPSQPPAVLSTSPSAPSGNGTPEGSRSPAEPTRYVPKRKAVTNPFVSGGFLSDFVTTTTKTTTTPQPSSRPASPKQLEPQAQSSAVCILYYNRGTSMTDS
ncbi:hypothetical protein BXZ70DRAFT_174397 [Cristinia sonorae]|uniref:Uncharacterized protein n=1 Tax=Cristinia sonorae TaxID=1940300 RepID=A0A8K0UNS5_9AGAR|nr:hypothetical protein BXZ70DRAFT_174397 [Cristinia sonorae]